MVKSDSDLDSLRLHPPKLGEILEACPFDFMRNFNARLSEALFFARFFVDSDASRSMVAELRHVVTNPLVTSRVIFLHGFGGSGKTTFLRHFSRQNPDLRANFVDFHSPLPTMAPDTPMTSVIRQEIRDAPQAMRIDALTLLRRNSERLSRYFSQLFLEELKVLEEADMERDHLKLLEATTFSDAFLLYLLLLIHRPDKCTIELVCFDNLDRVELEYISDNFRQDFAIAVETATKLFQLADFLPYCLDFGTTFRFLFALRDANFAVIDAHTVGSWGATLEAVPFSVRLEPETYKRIVEARLAFVALVQPANGHPEVLRAKADLEDLLELFLPGGDPEPYFEKVIMPLFNYDFKKVCAFFLRVAGRYGLLGPGRQRRLREGETQEAQLLRYGLRGSLLFHFVAMLMRDDYLREYAFYEYPFLDEDGYCLHSRMVLTALLNSCHYDASESGGAASPDREAASLLTVLEKHWGVYPLREVLHTIADAFLFHQKNWVHLVTIPNKRVEARGSFDEELVWLQEKGLANEVARVAGSFGALFDSRERAALELTKIRLNPAGFTYLKFVVMHFEYYSALAKNRSPLFLSGLERVNENGEYQFERIIDSVLRLVTSPDYSRGGWRMRGGL